MGKRKVPETALQLANQAARDIRHLEGEASQALDGAGDTAVHRERLTRKCLILEALPVEVEPLLTASSADGVRDFAAGLEDFAKRAEQALSLESIFFMGALLYPEDYETGEPNDLERFLSRFEAV